MIPPMITINNQRYEITTGEFGEKLVNGMTQLDFMDWLKLNDPKGFVEVAIKGADIILNEPERFEDIAERIEMPKEQVEIAKSIRDKTTKCRYRLAWIGTCTAIAVDNGFCLLHANEKCQCGKQAVAQCDAAGSMVCGTPHCADVTSCHYHTKKDSKVW